jgi:hypothetical protein
MKKAQLFLVATIMILPIFLFAQIAAPTEPQTIEDAIKFLPTLIEFFKNGNYLAGGAVLTLLAVFVIKKYALPKLGLKPAILPIVAAVLGCLIGLAVAILGGAKPAQAALAVFSGPAASLLWDAVVKFFIPEKPVV